jgi:hypothetical protein
METLLNNKIKNCPVCRRDLREEILNILPSP